MAKGVSGDVIGGIVVLGGAVIAASIVYQIGRGKNFPGLSKELNLTATTTAKTLFKD